ncbi:acyl carrier protein [Nitrospira sp. M1]
MEDNVDLAHIRKFIVEHIPRVGQLEDQDDAQLLEDGLLDSLGILDVVTYLEEEFGISISDEELTPDNFQSIRTMVLFVQKKKNHVQVAD